jgi:hypothetical protein
MCYERFCVPPRLGANWGYWPSDSVFDQGGGVHHKLPMFLTWMGYFACHWHRHQVQGTSVLRLIRRTRAIEVKQLAQGCKQTWQCQESNPQPSDHGSKTLTTRPRRSSNRSQSVLNSSQISNLWSITKTKWIFIFIPRTKSARRTSLYLGQKSSIWPL